jgi:hypothetical protein
VLPFHRTIGRLGTSSAIVFLFLSLPGCTPVPVRVGEVTSAPISVNGGDSRTLNILAIGRVGTDGRFVAPPRASGFAVNRGDHLTIAVIGPGMETGTLVGVVGVGFDASPIAFDTISGGTFNGQPVAVFSLFIPPYAYPGLYSVIAGRGTDFSVLAGSLEVQ